jgi:hypothetical protein
MERGWPSAWSRGRVVQAIVLGRASSNTVEHDVLVVNQQAFREFSIYHENWCVYVKI